MTGSERRRSKRAPLRCDAVVFVGSQQFSCRAVDVGASGIALTSAVPQLPGQFLRINFTLDSGRWVDADGVVVRDELRERSHLLGVQFQGLDAGTVDALRAYVGEPSAGDAGPAVRRPRTEPSGLLPRMGSKPRAADMVEPPPPSRVQSRPSRPVAPAPKKPRPPADLLAQCLEMKRKKESS